MGYSVVGLSDKDLTRPNSELQILDAKELFVVTNVVSSDGKRIFNISKTSSGLEFISLISPGSNVNKDWNVLDPELSIADFQAGDRNLVLFSSLSQKELVPVISKLKQRLILVANQSTGDLEKLKGFQLFSPEKKENGQKVFIKRWKLHVAGGLRYIRGGLQA